MLTALHYINNEKTSIHSNCAYKQFQCLVRICFRESFLCLWALLNLNDSWQHLILSRSKSEKLKNSDPKWRILHWKNNYFKPFLRISIFNVAGITGKFHVRLEWKHSDNLNLTWRRCFPQLFKKLRKLLIDSGTWIMGNISRHKQFLFLLLPTNTQEEWDWEQAQGEERSWIWYVNITWHHPQSHECLVCSGVKEFTNVLHLKWVTGDWNQFIKNPKEKKIFTLRGKFLVLFLWISGKLNW